LRLPGTLTLPASLALALWLTLRRGLGLRLAEHRDDR
jgi:hypothetical protein